MADYAKLLQGLQELRDRVEQLISEVSSLQQAGPTGAATATAPPPAEPEKVFLPTLLDDVEPILGGKPTSEFPDCCAVGGNEFAGYFCTGTLIAPNLVLTARHCSRFHAITRVFLRGNDVSKPQKGEEIAVKEQFDHEEVDLKLLVLQRDSKVKPRHIARDDEVKGKEAVVVGFGTIDPAGSFGYGVKRMAKVRINSLDCGSEQDRQKYGCKKSVELVAGHRGIRKDTCRGDSGGPLYIESEFGGYYLLGATSRGITGVPNILCGNGGIYIRVDQFLSWIEEKTGLTL